MALPSDDKARKEIRAFQGFLKYFPDAIALVALLSKRANEQHNPGQPMHWAKEKSTEELDSLMSHLIDIGAKGRLSQDADGVLDAIKVAWRGMANVQRLVDEFGMEHLLELMNQTPYWVQQGSSATVYDCYTSEGFFGTLCNYKSKEAALEAFERILDGRK